MVTTFGTINMSRIKKLLFCLLIPQAVGLLSYYFIRGNMDYYKVLALPPLAPPTWVFPLVWTTLFLLMGIASYLVYMRGRDRTQVRDALKMYAIMLVFTFLWPLVFFNLRTDLFAFLILLVQWIFTGITAAQFYRTSHAAGYLMLPVWIWVTFAGYLNLAIWFLN